MNSQNKALFDPIAQFCKDVGDHQMTILKDEGLYRHIRFAVPNYYHFLWCCAAVAWAVAFYDAHRPDVSSAAVSDLSDADLAAYCGA